jgi:hypothetical protein
MKTAAASGDPGDEPKDPIEGNFQLDTGINSALEQITRGEIDIQIATAKRWPRSIAEFKQNAIAMATIDEETAASCLYARPVGRDPETGKQKIAEGMSVRMAEIVAACFGNIRFASMIIEMTPRYVKCRGMAHDLQANSAGSSEVIEATVKKPKAGQKEGDPYDERMRAVIAKACLSKARRDAIFQVVPKALAKPIEKAVRALLAGDGKSITRRRAIVMKWITGDLKIEPSRVFAALGIKGEDDLTTEMLDQLTGIRTAINDGDVTVDEAFPPIVRTGAVGTAAPKTTATEDASGENPQPQAPATGAKPPTEKPKPEPKAPSVDSLRKAIVKTITPRNVGKARLMTELREMELVVENAEFDDLSAEKLTEIQGKLPEILDKIAPPPPA